MDLELNGKRAIVCGSSQGIGRAIAMELAGKGAAITLIARNQTALEQVREHLNHPQKHDIIAVDFANVSELEQKINQYTESRQAIHILVNNTGGPPAGPASQADVNAYLQAFSNHLICNQTLLKAVLPGMKKAGYGRIINIISTSVKQPIRGLGVSNTIRGAVANWAKTLADELGPHGITVNNVLPGATKTARLDALIAGKAAKEGKSEQEVAAQMKAAIPARRFAEPEELAAAVAFLASPAAGYINGINLPVDGGRTMSL